LRPATRCRIAASGNPEKIDLLTTILAKGAQPRWASRSRGGADIVVLANPAAQVRRVRPCLGGGKLVVETMTYWPRSTAFRRCSKITVRQREIVKPGLARLHDRPEPQPHATTNSREQCRSGRRAVARSSVAGTTRARSKLVAEFIERVGYRHRPQLTVWKPQL